MKIFRYTIQYTYNIKGRLFLGIFFLVVSAILSILNPLLVGKYIDLISSKVENLDVIKFVLLLVIMWLVGMIISHLNTINTAYMDIRLTYNINFHLLQRIERFPYAKLSKMDTDYLNIRIHNDSSIVTSFFLNTLLDTTARAIICVVVLFVILNENLLVGFLTILLLPLYVATYACFKCVIEQCSKEAMEKRDVFFGEMQKQLHYVHTVKLNSWYDRLYSTLMKKFEFVYKSTIKSTKINVLYSSFTQTIKIVANLIIFLVCGIAVSEGSMNLGSLITVNSLFSILFSSFTSLMDFGKSYANVCAAFSRINELEMVEEEKDGKIVLKKITSIYANDLSFKYPDGERNIIDRVSFEFYSGNIYQLTGANGSGKSTLLDLLLGLYKTSGEICFNKISIDQLNMRILRQNLISIVEQEPPLIFETLFDNITNGDIDSTKLFEMAKNPDFVSLIGNMDFSKNYRVIDGTKVLSGGEKQKVAIVRALLKNSDVLIFDEPTSALDSASCDRLKKILKELKKDRIIILIDHQPIFSDIIDIVYDLHMGKVTEMRQNQ